MIDIGAIRQRNEWRKNHHEESQAPDGDGWTLGAPEDIDALLAEVERLQQPLRCTLCGAPDEVHVQDPTNPRFWRIWMPDPNYPLWGTSHSKVMRRVE